MSPLTRHRRAALFAALFLLCPLLSAVASAKPVLVSGIRFWTNEEYTRVAIDVEGEAAYEANFLKADPLRNLPPRIFVDIRGAVIREEILRRPVEVRNGLLKVVRAGRFRKDVVRVVIDLEKESGFRAVEMSDPYRIIIDVDAGVEGAGPLPARETEEKAETRSARESAERREKEGKPEGATVEENKPTAPEPADRDPRVPPAPARGRGKIRVMLDPGHGGKDPGAIGPSGLKEKDVVLSIGKMLRDRLQRSGEFEVLMTRDTDVFIPLEERTAMANKARADIFVSLHINASPNRKAEGISTYVLSRASDRQSLELAARENGVSVKKLSEVRFILDDLSTYGRKKESLRLAKTVNDAIVRNVSHRHGQVHNLGLKQAPFYVLVGARMTAVLVEASFISNNREEARLKDAAYHETIAESVVEAVRYYGAKGALARAVP